jgi:S-formylglutathione hydrolase
LSLETIAENRCFGGVQGIYAHAAETTACRMRFALFRPAQAEREPRPVLWWLSGLTCTEENFTFKAGAQRFAAEYGLILVAPDTSPRGVNLPGDSAAYDFGVGAGFYLDATVEPWARHYKMESYVTKELPALVFDRFPARRDRQGIFGHSMGGHGALTLALKNPAAYRSVSAFSPIVAPMRCPWGQKAFKGYLGADQETWRPHDATELIQAGKRHAGTILIDQGSKDQFLREQLMPELFVAACREAGQKVELRLQDGYDHSYYFIATFIGDHFRHHAAILGA